MCTLIPDWIKQSFLLPFLKKIPVLLCNLLEIFVFSSDFHLDTASVPYFKKNSQVPNMICNIFAAIRLKAKVT